MAASSEGLVPQRDVLDRYLASMPELDRPDVPRHRVELLEPLLDSADMVPADWLRIAKAIVARDAEFDGFAPTR
jgi:L-asparaginase